MRRDYVRGSTAMVAMFEGTPPIFNTIGPVGPVNLYIGLVDPIALVRGLQMQPAPLIQFRRIGLDRRG